MSQTQHKSITSTKSMVCCAFLAALSVVMARVLSFAVPGGARYSLDKFPLFLAGMLFGPVMGSVTGFVADFLGSLMQFGFNPLFCPPAILYGLAGGLFRWYIRKNPSILRIGLSYLCPVVVGSILYQSASLAYVYNDGVFIQAFLYNLASRSIQFGITLVLEVLIIHLLMEMKVFVHLGVWPPVKKERKSSHMNVDEAIAYIHSVYWKGSIPGLGRTQELLAKMGNPEKNLKYVHIAGTNGKGSTAAMTASILQQAGYRVGLYTSPYIYRFHERMQVNGVEISDEDIVAITEYVKPLADSMEESPTEFELVCGIAFEYFSRQKCDIVVLEVGMGGAFDATNVIECPEVAVITNIGLDHTEVLGDTVEKIAETKSGIFKEGGHAVVYRGTESVEKVFEDVCAQRHCSLKKADFDGLKLHHCDLTGQVFDCGNRKNLELPLLGVHQLKNAAVVLAIADTLKEIGWNITEENIRDGLKYARWPGRFDIVGHDPLFIIDGGHNPQCIEALVLNIQDYLKDQRVIALTGVLADKDYGDMYKPVLPLVQEFVCVTPPNDRKLEATELAEHLRRVGATATPCATVEEGVHLAVERAGKYGVVLCFGSLYTIGSIKEALDAMQ